MPTSLDGSILVSKKTIINLLQACRSSEITTDSTLVEFGMEEQKKKFALILQKEFNLDLGLNPASQLTRELMK